MTSAAKSPRLREKPAQNWQKGIVVNIKSLSQAVLRAGGTFLVLAVWLISVAPCGAASAETVLRVAKTSIPRILDPHFTTSFTERDFGYLIYDTLFAVDKKFEIKPQMVETWTVSGDHLTYTFTLRDGLLFHDGAPVRSADCVTSLKRWAQRDGMGQ